MTSSMLTGERRWASARRGGMTVLGKVAVPKPINLPSQKLENHGLDPNVEIVPKGTLSWGSRSSSSATNAWGSSALSPNADGGASSPSHLSARPSSGGSGTRPSSSSSDRAHEPMANAWGSNSRPSSASGVLTSNQTSTTSLRPRSAETRPGSSQLSRFAEPISENSVAWGTAGTAEKLGVKSSKNDGFSLTSGDFPTLGAEKDNVGKNTELQDHSSHGQPDLSSGGVALVKDRTETSLTGDVSVNANVRTGTANSWRRDNNPYCEDGGRPNVEKWQADPHGPHSYPNASIPPQHYEAWHGPPISNHPGGVWYRGPPINNPGGPPYGSPVPPGGFPMEPFHFYRPPMPTTALGNPQPVPPPGAGPRAHHPKNGDMYRPPMPDAYMRPGMPIRPGFYPGPVPYEGYFGPPMGYRNPNERDVPFMGVAAGPAAYNRYAGQNAHDPGNSHGLSGGYGPNGKLLASEQVEPSRPLDGRGPYRVLLKQQDGWEGKDEEQKWEDNVVDASHNEKGDQPRTSSWENDWRGDCRKDEEMSLKRNAIGGESSFQACNHIGGSSVPVKCKSPEVMMGTKVFDDISMKKLEHPATAFPEIPAAPKDSTLIQKIEGLNAKARAADGRHDLMSVSSREEQKNKPQVNPEANHSADGCAAGSLYSGRNHASGISNPAAQDDVASAGDKIIELTAASGTVVSRRSAHGMHVRTDHRGKGRFNNQEVDGWRKKSLVADSSGVISATHSENSSVHLQDHTPNEIDEKSGLYLQGKDEGESVPPIFDPSDSQAQRAKMKELAKQRVKQRQKEEEERARDQKAKALAKLEELNRRTQAVEGSAQKSEIKQEEAQLLADSITIASKSGASSSTLVFNSNNVAQISESSGTIRVDKSSVLSNERLPERPKSAHKESIGMRKHDESMPMMQDVNDAVHQNNAPQLYDGNASKQKGLSYKQKQNILSERNSSEKITSISTTESMKGHSDLIINAATSIEVMTNDIGPSCESSLPVNPNVAVESSSHQRRRNNRSGKKHKVEEASSAALPEVTETNIVNVSGESGKTKASESELDPSSVQSLTDPKDANQSSDLRLSSPTEENHGRANNQWKSQHTRRTLRSTQANKSTEKFHSSDAVIWAPVRTQNKVEVNGDASEKSVVEASSVKSDHQGQNNSRNKRAEMERYIPKPVAKEMAQQSSSQQQLMAPSVDQTMLHEIVGRADSVSQGVESSQPAGVATGKGVAMESKNGDIRQNKQGKVHGSWRQRASAESAVVQGAQDAESSNISKKVQKSVEHPQPQKSDGSSVMEQPKNDNEWGSDGWNIPEKFDSAVPLSVPVVKDQGVTARGKRHQFKGQKGSGHNHDHDHKKINSGDNDKFYAQASPEMSQTDLPSASKENRTSQWQPKPLTVSASNQRVSQPNNGQTVGAEVGRVNKKDLTTQDNPPIQPQLDKETTEFMAQPLHGQSASHTSKVEEAPNAGNQEVKRERKIASFKGRPHSPNQGPDNLGETGVPSNTEIRHEQRGHSGFRRNGSQSSRFGRGHESRGDWGSSGQDNKQHNQPINRERQRHSSHYEYQPVGTYNNSSKANNLEAPKDAPNSAGGRYRERSQNHSRRGGGNFHGRPSGSVRAADSGYD